MLRPRLKKGRPAEGRAGLLLPPRLSPSLVGPARRSQSPHPPLSRSSQGRHLTRHELSRRQRQPPRPTTCDAGSNSSSEFSVKVIGGRKQPAGNRQASRKATKKKDRKTDKKRVTTHTKARSSAKPLSFLCEGATSEPRARKWAPLLAVSRGACRAHEPPRTPEASALTSAYSPESRASL